MFTYDEKSHILKVQKVPEPDVELGLLEHQRASYNKYITETVLQDLQLLGDALKKRQTVSAVSAEFKVDPVYQDSYHREIKKQAPRYYPVRAKFVIDGVTYPPANDPTPYMEVLRVPAMDADGILNIDGNRYILLMQMAAAERISYDAEKRTISVTTPQRNISINFDTPKGAVVKYGPHNKIPLHKLIRAFNAKEHVGTDPASLFASAYVKSAFAVDAGVADITIEDELDKLQVYAKYHSPEYALGSARSALNEALSLERARDKVLSRPVGQFPAGRRVDNNVLSYAYQNQINELYVRAIPDIVGSKLTEPVYITHIPEGTRNNTRLQGLLPQYSKFVAIPQDCDVLDIINKDTPLTSEDVILLYDIEMPNVVCKRRGSKPCVISFEEEIIGNYTVKLGAAKPIIPEGRAHDEWVYYYGNPDLEPCNPEYLTTHDLIALYSLSAFIRKNPDENYLLDKDFGLLKKVRAANELFSEALQAVIPKFMRVYQSSIGRAISGEGNLESKHFFGLTTMWLRYLRETGYIAIADTINPMATLTQVNHLLADVHSSEVPDKLRLMAMGYYGRICPYETPSGKKLGLTHTKAIGARIKDGILTTPYRKILFNSAGEIEGISQEITYMDAQEEASFRIGDLLSLEQRNGKYLNNKVMARVPAPNNQVTVESVDAFSLEYVNAYCEQHLSPTVALIPFTGSNDAVRVTYAASMLKQSILVQSNQIPRVLTSMYRRCFEHSNTYVIRAKKDGEVFDIPVGKLQLTYYNEDGSTEEVDIPIQETGVATQSVNYLNFHVKAGDKFKAGDVLISSAIAKEGIYSPGVNLFTAWVSNGYNYEDAVVASDNAANQLISISPETVVQRVRTHTNESISVGREYYYRYIPENGVIAYVKRRSTADNRHQTRDALHAGMHSGILYQIERNSKETNSVEYSAHLLAFNRLRVGDKISGRHGNKGTISIVAKNSDMPCFANGRPVDILFNPLGVPSRMNIGQGFEAYLGFIATLLDVHIESNSFNGATLGDIKLLMRYVWDLANNVDANAVCSRYPMLPDTLHTRAKERHAAIREWAGCFDPDGTARLWNPSTGKYLEGKVTFGVSYVLKLKHEVNNKSHVRAGQLEEDYSLIYKQPTQGAARGGGQKMGEMELCALAAYGASSFLEETCNELSDNVLGRTATTLKMLGLEEYIPGLVQNVPHAVEMLRYYLEVMGLKLVDDENLLPASDSDSAKSRAVPDVRGILAAKKSASVSGSDLTDMLKEEFS